MNMMENHKTHKANLCPGHGMSGRHPTREGLGRLSGHDDPGMFGRMFPDLDPLDVPDDKLKALAAAMLENNHIKCDRGWSCTDCYILSVCEGATRCSDVGPVLKLVL